MARSQSLPARTRRKPPAPVLTRRPDGGIDLKLPPALGRTLVVGYRPARTTAYGPGQPDFVAYLGVGDLDVVSAIDGSARISCFCPERPVLWIGGCAFNLTDPEVPVILEAFERFGLKPPRAAAPPVLEDGQEVQP